ncbi:polymorphic toxin type 44 domain-containing protein [Streptococcus oricebi]|nr:polymorphic toxin type 44 domain-containing protein [Streptococcus oricebi]
MGIKVDMAALSSQASTGQTVMTARANGYQSLITALQSFINAADLQGAAHNAEKDYAMGQVLPLLNGLILLTEDGAADLVELSNKYASEVGESLDEDELTSLLEACQKVRGNQEAILANMTASNPSSTLVMGPVLGTIEALRTKEKDIQDKLDKLRKFNASAASIFTGIDNLTQAVTTALNQLQGSYDTSTGTYKLSADRTWIGEIDIYRNSKMKHVEKRIEQIKNSNLSEEEKANQIVKAYEDYLYATNREAFDEYSKKRKAIIEEEKRKGIEEKDIKLNAKNPKVKNMEDELEKNLQKSGVDIKVLLQEIGDHILEIEKLKLVNFTPIAGTSIIKNWDFADLVNTGKPLDLKNRVYDEKSGYSVWARQWAKGISSDYTGNYLYGYIGKGYLNAADSYLKSMAGLAQVFSDLDIIKYGKSLFKGEYGDNSGDAKAIQDGIDAYKRREK